MKTCKNCIHFESNETMFGNTLGNCKNSTITSAPFMADFISTEENKPIKVWWNFGCVRFEKKTSVITYTKTEHNIFTIIIAIAFFILGFASYWIINKL